MLKNKDLLFKINTFSSLGCRLIAAPKCKINKLRERKKEIQTEKRRKERNINRLKRILDLMTDK